MIFLTLAERKQKIMEEESQDQNTVNMKKAETEPETNTECQLSPALSMLINKGGYQLPPVAIKLIEAVASDLGDPNGFTPRHKLNQKSPSFPYNHRTIANRDSLGTGPKERLLIGKYMFHRNLSILEMLCEDLSK